MDLVARNMLYPAITFNDTELNKFYQGLELKEDTNQFTDMLLVGWQFSMRRELLKYSYTGGVDRGEFGDTTIVNAFYNPVLNSITILAGITHQPAYDEKWPKAFLYGAFGLVLGHEMHHGTVRYTSSFNFCAKVWIRAVSASTAQDDTTIFWTTTETH